MHLGEELIVLGILLLLAYVLGRLGKLVGLPSIPIYMLVGLLASTNTGWFPISFDSHSIELIAIFGLILLLFNLGLEFDQDEFFSNAGRLIVSGGSYIAVNMGVGLVALVAPHEADAVLAAASAASVPAWRLGHLRPGGGHVILT